MTTEPAECTQVHTRLLKCALEVEDARSYWAHAAPGTPIAAKTAFADYWFGARSLARVEVLLTNFRARFDAFPDSGAVLHAWRDMTPDTRVLVCHWHMQLADPLYRAFSGDWLVARRAGIRAEVSLPVVVAWVGEQGRGRWTMTTRQQFASKLLSVAHSAGLVAGVRDPRALAFPRVPDDALSYLLHLLRGVRHEGTPLDNPYLRSVGLSGPVLHDRLRALPELRFGRQADLVDFGWRYASLTEWALARGLPMEVT